MSKKKANNEGSIYKRKDGRWCGTITIGYKEDGSQKRKSVYGKTKTEVLNKLNQLRSDIVTGVFVDTTNITLSQWLKNWLFNYKKNEIRATTFEQYESLIRIHISPEIGKMKIQNIRPEHIQTLYNKKLQEGLSGRTVQLIHTVLHQSLAQAMNNNLIPRNIIDAVKRPKSEKKDIRILTLDEQRTLLNSLEDSKLRCAFIVALSSGVRVGELLALKWDNVDLKQGIIEVTSTIKRTKEFDSNGNYTYKVIFSKPKTKTSIRKIPLPDSVITELKEHRLRQNENKLQKGPLYEDYNMVFASEIGTPIDYKNLIREFIRVLKKAKLESINFHALRHTYATRLLEMNEHPKVVSELLGHNSISITLDIYSHVLPEIKQAAASKINHLFEIDKSKKSTV